MPYKDKDKAREYQREWQRKRRSSTKDNRVGSTGQGLALQLETLEDLRIVLERITGEVLYDESLDLGIKGRIISQLLTVGIRLIEGTDLEHRITALEERAEMSKYA